MATMVQRIQLAELLPNERHGLSLTAVTKENSLAVKKNRQMIYKKIQYIYYIFDFGSGNVCILLYDTYKWIALREIQLWSMKPWFFCNIFQYNLRMKIQSSANLVQY